MYMERKKPNYIYNVIFIQKTLHYANLYATNGKTHSVYHILKQNLNSKSRSNRTVRIDVQIHIYVQVMSCEVNNGYR